MQEFSQQQFEHTVFCQPITHHVVEQELQTNVQRCQQFWIGFKILGCEVETN